MPTNAPLIALYLTVFNFLMTFPAVYLVERLGRRTLLLGSIAGMGGASFMLGWGLNAGKNGLSAVGVFGFVSPTGRERGRTRRGELIDRVSFLSVTFFIGWILCHRIRTRPLHHQFVSLSLSFPSVIILSPNLNATSASFLTSFLPQYPNWSLLLPVPLSPPSPFSSTSCPI